MEREFSDFVVQKELISKPDRVLAAVSGGVDSVTMAYLLHRAGTQMALAHVNYQLRGQDSDFDQQLVKDLASQWGLKVYTTRVDTVTYAKSQGLSIQMAAREIRYQWFQELALEHGFTLIATAHHMDDNLETMLLNFTKGTGIKGLHGILPRQGNIIRPLLFSAKKQILQYAHQRGLNWRADHSNSQNYYQRNLIRNKVVPLLQELNPKVSEAASQTAEILRGIEEVWEEHLAHIKDQLMVKNGHHFQLNKQRLEEQPLTILFEIFREFGFNYAQVKDVKEALSAQSGKMFHSNEYMLNLDRECLLLKPLTSKQGQEKVIPGLENNQWSFAGFTWKMEKRSASNYQIKEDSAIGAWDLSSVRFPLEIRPWRAGDRFQPLGMSGTKKVSDYLVDVKIPLAEKPDQLVVLSAGQIVWLVNQRIDDRFKITDSTREILQIEVEPQE